MRRPGSGFAGLRVRRRPGRARVGRRRSRSPASRIRPFTVRNAAAANGLANTTRSSCSNNDADDARPGSSRRSAAVPRRAAGDTIAPLARAAREVADDLEPVAAGSRRTARARCRRGARRGTRGRSSRSDCAFTRSVQPSNAAMSTECPRLDTGNSSVTPWNRPMTIARKYDSLCTVGEPRRIAVRTLRAVNGTLAKPCTLLMCTRRAVRLVDLVAGEAARELLEPDPALEPGERGAEAEVQAVAEAERRRAWCGRCRTGRRRRTRARRGSRRR